MSRNSSRNRSGEWFSRQLSKVKGSVSSKSSDAAAESDGIPTGRGYLIPRQYRDSSPAILQAGRTSTDQAVRRGHAPPGRAEELFQNEGPGVPEIQISAAESPLEGLAKVDPDGRSLVPIIPNVTIDQGASSATTNQSSFYKDVLDGHSGGIPQPTCWEKAFAELTADQCQVLESFRIQNTETLQAEINTLHSMKDGCKSITPGIIDKKPIMTRVRIHSILKKMEKYAIIGDIALQQNPNIVALVWAGVRFCLQVALNDMHTFEGVSSALDGIAGVLGSCRIYERIYDSELVSAKAVIEQLPRLYAHCLRFMAKAIDYFQRTTARRVAKGATNPFETSFKPLIDEMNNSKAELERRCAVASRELQDKMSDIQREQFGKLGAQVAQFQQQMAEVSSGIDRIKAQVGDDQRRQILNWLSTVDFPAHHENARGLRFDGSGEWLFEKPEFQDWIEMECSSVMWLSGKAGSGKTILSSLVIDALSETYKSVPTIYFYCHYAEPNRQKTSFIIGSLLKQLSTKRWCGSLDPQMVALFKDGSDLNPKTAETLFATALARFDKVLIVIDALDECSEKERKATVMLLIRQLNLNAGCLLKILFTSRPEHDLQQLLKVGSWHQIDANDTLKDITPFVEAELDDHIESHALLDGNVSSELRQELIDKITSQADGMFLWARFQLDHICKQGNEDQVRSQLTKLPRGLQNTYERIWNKITNAEPTERDWAMKTLSWVLVAEVPLAPELILEATAREPFHALNRGRMASSIEYLVRACCNFVTLDRNTNRLRFIHYSVQEFLRDKEEFYSAAECAAEVCLTVLCDQRLPLKTLPGDLPQTGATLHLHAVHHWHQYCTLWEVIDERRGELIRRFLLGDGTFDCWRENRFDWQDPVKSVYGAAAYLNLPVILQYLQQLGAQDDGFADDQSTALIVAARAGHVQIVKILLDIGADVNVRPGSERPRLGGHGEYDTPLAAATTTGSEELVSLLLSAGADVSAAGGSALLGAVSCGSEGIVELLLDAGADPNTNSSRSRPFGNPLDFAAIKGSKKMVELLLQAGARLDAEGFIFARSLQRGHYHLIELMLSAGANPNGADRGRGTPLSLVTGRPEAVKLLLDAGARPDAGGAALRKAVQRCSERCVELLLSAGADPNAVVDESCETALMLSVRQCNGRIPSRAQEDRRRDAEQTALVGAFPRLPHTNPYWAAEKVALRAATQEKIMKLLLNAGADVNVLSKGWGTSLHQAVSNSTQQAVELLLNAGSDVNASGPLGTALDIAIERGDEGIINLLLARGAIDRTRQIAVHEPVV